MRTQRQALRNKGGKTGPIFSVGRIEFNRLYRCPSLTTANRAFERHRSRGSRLRPTCAGDAGLEAGRHRIPRTAGVMLNAVHVGRLNHCAPAITCKARKAMPLPKTEVELGVVAYFDSNALLSDPDIDRDDDGLNRPGPFVCVQIKGDRSVWCALTSEWRAERLPLQPEWRRNGSPKWTGIPQYLHDGLATYLGPTMSFVHAAAAETPFVSYPRPSITLDGVTAILAEIERQGGPLL